MKKYRRSSLTLFLLLSLFAHAAIAQQPAEFQQASARLAGSILVNGRAMDYLQNLTEKFGGRLTGTDAYRRSAEWAADQFRAMGIKNVKLEPFTIPGGWDRGYARGRMLAPIERHISVESLGWSPSTPAGGIKGDVITISDFAPEKIKAQSDKIKGRIVMLDLTTLFADGLSSFSRLMAAISALKEVGAGALILADSERNNVLNAFALSRGAQRSPLPIAQVGMEDGKLTSKGFSGL